MGKKILIMLLIAAMALMCFCACSYNGESGEQSAQVTPTEQTQETTPSQKASPPPVQPTPEPTPQIFADSPEDISIKRDLLVFMMAYSDYITGVEKESGSVYVIMKSGNRILYDDKQQKTYDQKMENADLQDCLELLYPLGGAAVIEEGNFDPGRFRPYALFSEVYGADKKAISSNLEKTSLGGKKYYFNKNNGALEAIQKVFGELDGLCAENADVKKSVYPLSGTFCYRYISGTKLLSMHSYAVAVDLHASLNPSFRSASAEKGRQRIEAFPAEIVRVFEENGFIWGGRWAHFDIMHFEYRPEIIIKAKYYTDVSAGQTWYEGFPDDAQTKGFETVIDMAFSGVS